MTTVTASAPGTRRVEHCMGTVFTIDIRDAGHWADAIDEAVTWLHHVDGTFSTYKEDSDISRLRAGRLSMADADPDVAIVVALCEAVARATDGYFSATPHGLVDPTGLVKGWAIERAANILWAHGSRNHAVNGGGDIQLVGQAGPDQPWTVGISDPQDGLGVLATVTGRDFAIATSGVAERGRHIINPHRAGPADDLASVTLVGPSLTLVDAYATAAFAMGRAAVEWIESMTHLDGLLVFPDGRSVATSGFPTQPGTDELTAPRR